MKQFIVFVSFSVFCGTAIAIADERADIAAAMGRYRRNFPAVSGQIRSWRFELSPAGKEDEKGERKFAERQFDLFYEGDNVEWTYRYHKPDGTPVEETVIQNGQYNAVVKPKPEGSEGDWLLSYIGTTNVPTNISSLTPVANAHRWLHVAVAPNFIPVDLESIFDGRTGTVKRIGETNHGGRRLVEYEFIRNDGGTPEDPITSGRVFLLPDRDWILHAATLDWRGSDEDQSTVSVSIEYEDMEAGFPLPTSYREDIVLIVPESDSSIGSVREFDLKALSEFPEQTFTLAKFGIPEPGAPQQTRFSMWIIALNCVFVICLVIWVWLRRSGETAS